jgi:hypothetical protein
MIHRCQLHSSSDPSSKQNPVCDHSLTFFLYREEGAEKRIYGRQTGSIQVGEAGAKSLIYPPCFRFRGLSTIIIFLLYCY